MGISCWGVVCGYQSLNVRYGVRRCMSVGVRQLSVESCCMECSLTFFRLSSYMAFACVNEIYGCRCSWSGRMRLTGSCVTMMLSI